MDYLMPRAAIDDGILRPMDPTHSGPYYGMGLGGVGLFPDTPSPMIPSDIDTPTASMFLPRLGGLSSVSDMVSVFSLVDYLTGK